MYKLLSTLIFTVLVSVCRFFVRMSFYPKVHSLNSTYKHHSDNKSFNQERYEKLNKQEFYFISRFKYKLNCVWIPNLDSKKTVILVHGYTANHNSSLKYFDMFYDKGYNILMYDHRYHGRSEGENCTLGYYEKYDLKDLVTWVLRKVGKNSIVGIHGESMGASTAIMHSAIDNRTKFTIADCPFQDVRFQFKHRLKVEYNVPAFPILNVIGIFNKIITGVSYRKISPIKITPLITTPILYIHGDMDDFTLPINSVNLYKATKCKKKIYLAKNAKHAKSITTNPKVYKKIVFNFIDTIS